MRVFVTGATGFIGQATVKELLQAGHQVLGLARSDESAAKLVALGAEAHKGDLNDLESLKSGAAASDGVIHLAFEHDFANFEKCCNTDKAAIEAIGGALEGTNRPFVMASGTLMISKMTPETEPYLAQFFQMAKIRGASETIALSLVPKGVHTVVLRLPPTNHGDGDKGFVPMLIETAKKSGESAYIADGSNVWPAVHYLDTATAFKLALEKAKPGSVFEVVADEGVPTKSIAELIGTKLNVPTVSKPREEAMAHFGFVAVPFMANNPVSGESIKQELGWKPVHPSLLDDIKDGTYFSSV
jgi:nucleoside-diphosphate-sugar epimerase